MTNEQMDEWHAARKDQLPWQVIMIGDPDMVRNLESHCSYRARRARETLRRRSAASSSQPMQPGVPGLGGSARVFSEAHAPSELTTAAAAAAGGEDSASESVVARLAEALGSLEAQQLASRAAQAEIWAEASGGNAVDYATAAKLYSEAADAASAAAAAAAQASSSSSGGGGSSLVHMSQWVIASLQFNSGRCWRRSRDLHAAKGMLGAGLKMAPRAVVGLHELALCHLDSGNYDDAKSIWEEVCFCTLTPTLQFLLIEAQTSFLSHTHFRLS
jgi:tetratricopeptide (TPR) repeat protein